MEFINDILEVKEFENNPVRTLSLGQRMRADIAAAIIHNPSVLYLDEPTIGLDVVVKDKMREAIKELNHNFKTTIILTTHDMVDIEKEVTIANPLLLIVGVRGDGLSAHTFYCYKNNKLLKYKKMIDLRNLFHGLQEQMLTSLNVNRMFIGHPGSKGDATEQHWIEFLRAYLPERYKVDKAIVIDSTGNVSEQMDVVIYDAIYTPFIFKQDGFMYIPAESVYAVFEVKQDVKGYIEYAAKKIESVRKLKRTSISMVASGITKPARPLTKIIGGILTTTSSYKENDRVIKQLEELKGLQTLDLGCLCDAGSFYVDYKETVPKDIDPITDNCKYIEQVYESREVKEIEFSNKEVSLFTFFLQLVSYLKSIGTVAAIDINVYLKAINAKIDEDI